MGWHHTARKTSDRPSEVQERPGGAAPAVQAGVDVLHDVLGGGQVPDHEQCQPDQFGVMIAEQRRDGASVQVGAGRAVSHCSGPPGGGRSGRRPGNWGMSHIYCTNQRPFGCPPAG